MVVLNDSIHDLHYGLHVHIWSDSRFECMALYWIHDAKSCCNWRSDTKLDSCWIIYNIIFICDSYDGQSLDYVVDILRSDICFINCKCCHAGGHQRTKCEKSPIETSMNDLMLLFLNYSHSLLA